MANDEKYKIQHYLQAISSQDSLLQSYRTLFLANETIFFGFAYFLYQPQNKEAFKKLLWLPPTLGIFFCVAWIFVCSHRGWMIDSLKEELKTLINSGQTTNLKGWFDLSYGKASSEGINLLCAYIGHAEKWVPRLVFNLVFPIVALVIWTAILFTT